MCHQAYRERNGQVGFRVLAHVTMDARVVSQANAKLRNLTGYADHHTLSFQYGGHSRHDFHGKDLAYKLRFARIFGRPLHSQLTLHRSNTDCRYESSYNELVRGTNFDLISCAPFSMFASNWILRQLCCCSLIMQLVRIDTVCSAVLPCQNDWQIAS